MGLSAIGNYFLPKNPVTGRREVHLIPAFVEKYVGESSFASQVMRSGGEVKGAYEPIVLRVGKALAAHAKRKDLEFDFRVIGSKEDNAWCLPGGKIGINIGLIQNMENEKDTFGLRQFTLEEKIAAVLSHEIIHADARHTGRSLEIRLFLIGIIKAAQLFIVHCWVYSPYQKKIDKARDNTKIVHLTDERDQKAKNIGAIFELASGWLLKGLTLCNSRSHELESDKYGMHLMKTGDISPEAAVWLQHYFKKHHQTHDHKGFLGRAVNLFSSHPAPAERLEKNQKTYAELTVR